MCVSVCVLLQCCTVSVCDGIVTAHIAEWHTIRDRHFVDFFFFSIYMQLYLYLCVCLRSASRIHDSKSTDFRSAICRCHKRHIGTHFHCLVLVCRLSVVRVRSVDDSWTSTVKLHTIHWPRAIGSTFDNGNYQFNVDGQKTMQLLLRSHLRFYQKIASANLVSTAIVVSDSVSLRFL